MVCCLHLLLVGTRQQVGSLAQPVEAGGGPRSDGGRSGGVLEVGAVHLGQRPALVGGGHHVDGVHGGLGGQPPQGDCKERGGEEREERNNAPVKRRYAILHPTTVRVQRLESHWGVHSCRGSTGAQAGANA